MNDTTHYFKENKEKFFEEFAEFLSFKSISTDPSYNEDCKACVDWLADKVRSLGFSVELLETSGKPCLYATFKGQQDLPVVLYYGHYDIQPVDPIEKWESDPYTATVREVNGLSRIFARGAQDNKGQTFYVLKALEYLVTTGQLKNPIKLLIEGEEECGSHGLSEALDSFNEKLQADLLLVCDTGVLTLDVPMVTVGLRGIAGLEVVVKGPGKDLHSGVHGGLVKNPALEMARVLALLKTEAGEVTVPGFYENLEPLGDSDLKKLEAFPITEQMYEASIGVKPTGGEQGLSMAQRRGVRPALDVTGMYSGYTGPGLKSVIPSEAVAKISMRLVPGQNPRELLTSLQQFITEKISPEFEVRFGASESTGGALRVSTDSKGISKAASVLKKQFNVDPMFCWEGASIPIIGALSKVSGAEPVMVGFGLEQDNIHAPNESFSWKQLELGFSFVSNFLAECGV